MKKGELVREHCIGDNTEFGILLRIECFIEKDSGDIYLEYSFRQILGKVKD